MARDPHKLPWYREPWVWLLILFPSLAVIGGMITIYLAISSSDGLVVDDYYKRGKAINRVLERDEAAARYGLRAVIEMYMQENRVQLQLQSTNNTRAPELYLSVLHPTQPGKDQVIRLTPIDENVYRGGMLPLGQGHWYLQLETDDWRLSGSVQVPLTGPVVLVPVQ